MGPHWWHCLCREVLQTHDPTELLTHINTLTVCTETQCFGGVETLQQPIAQHRVAFLFLLLAMYALPIIYAGFTNKPSAASMR